MSGIDRQLSQRKKVAGLSERLDLIEDAVEQQSKGTQQIIVAVNTALGQLGQQGSETREMVDALIQAVGVDVVQGIMEQNRLNAMKDAAEKTKANIAQAVKDGKLVKADKVSEKTLIVGKETKEDGTEVPPGFAAIGLQQVKKEFREKLTDQSVGFKMETESKGSFEILELYNPVEAPPAAAAEAPASPSAEQPAPTPAPAPEAAQATAPAGA